MSALIWDSTTQAFKDADTPKIYSGSGFGDAEGKIWNETAQAWEDAWSNALVFINGNYIDERLILQNADSYQGQTTEGAYYVASPSATHVSASILFRIPIVSGNYLKASGKVISSTRGSGSVDTRIRKNQSGYPDIIQFSGNYTDGVEWTVVHDISAYKGRTDLCVSQYVWYMPGTSSGGATGYIYSLKIED